MCTCVLTSRHMTASWATLMASTTGGRLATKAAGSVRPGGLDPPLEELDQPLVFGMKRDQPAGLLDQLEGAVDLVLLVDADAQELVLAPLGRGVRKDLEAAGALLRHAEHLVPVEQAGRPVEAKVDIRLGFAEVAAADQDVAAGAAGDADGHLEDRRDAAGRRSLGLGHKGAALRVAGGTHVKVDVDRARQEIAAVGGDLARCRRQGAGTGDGGNAVALNPQVGGVHVFVGDECGSLDG